MKVNSINGMQISHKGRFANTKILQEALSKSPNVELARFRDLVKGMEKIDDKLIAKMYVDTAEAFAARYPKSKSVRSDRLYIDYVTPGFMLAAIRPVSPMVDHGVAPTAKELAYDLDLPDVDSFDSIPSYYLPIIANRALARGFTLHQNLETGNISISENQELRKDSDLKYMDKVIKGTVNELKSTYPKVTIEADNKRIELTKMYEDKLKDQGRDIGLDERNDIDSAVAADLNKHYANLNRESAIKEINETLVDIGDESISKFM